jgi:ADP-dependent NAD(P)H-hydrate dehydratase / NAD(P)H-hydrate epimerase
MSTRFPRLRPYSRGDVLAQTAAEAASFDERAIRAVGVPQTVLMENAGRSAATIVVRGFRPARVVALVGSGNNGGDALVALRTLASWGMSVRAILVADRDPDDPLLHGWPLEALSDADLADAGWASALAPADVLLDGILGTGVRGAPRERQARAIERIERTEVPIVALDVPSGIDATTGAVPGAAVRAAMTIAFGAPKVGALLHPARARVGRHVAVEIGFPPLDSTHASAFAVTPSWARARLPRRDTDTHKNRVGRVLLVGGRVGMAGAVVLGARAALAGGAGLVRVCSVADNRAIVQAAVPEAIYVDPADGDALEEAVDSSDAVAAGPGMGTDDVARTMLRRVVETGRGALLLDADALNLVAAGAVDLIGAIEPGGNEPAGGDAPPGAVPRRPVLITPHPGEMGRLVETFGAAEAPGPDAPPTETARWAAHRFGCAVLLKGAPSLVARADGSVALDTMSSSDLAVAGMGDTLAGVCVALMAQGVEPATAGSLGLYLSGRAAVLAGRGAGLTPSDVTRWVPEALVESGAPYTDLDLPFVIFDADAAR